MANTQKIKTLISKIATRGGKIPLTQEHIVYRLNDMEARTRSIQYPFADMLSEGSVTKTSCRVREQRTLFAVVRR